MVTKADILLNWLDTFETTEKGRECLRDTLHMVLYEISCWETNEDGYREDHPDFAEWLVEVISGELMLATHTTDEEEAERLKDKALTVREGLAVSHDDREKRFSAHHVRSDTSGFLSSGDLIIGPSSPGPVRDPETKCVMDHCFVEAEYGYPYCGPHRLEVAGIADDEPVRLDPDKIMRPMADLFEKLNQSAERANVEILSPSQEEQDATHGEDPGLPLYGLGSLLATTQPRTDGSIWVGPFAKAVRSEDAPYRLTQKGIIKNDR